MTFSLVVASDFTTTAIVPVLSDPQHALIGPSFSLVAAVSDTAGGTIYCAVRTSGPYVPGEESIIKSGAGADFFDNREALFGLNPFPASGLQRDTVYYYGFVHEFDFDSNIVGDTFETLLVSILTAPTVSNIGINDAVVSVTSNGEGGILYAAIRTSGPYVQGDGPDIIAGVGAVWSDNQISVEGVNNFGASNLDATTTYFVGFVQDEGDGGILSNVAPVGFDTIDLVVLSNPRHSLVTENSATVTADADLGRGILYVALRTSGAYGQGDAENIKNGVGAAFSDNQVTLQGANNFPVTGLGSNIRYYYGFVQEE